MRNLTRSIIGMMCCVCICGSAYFALRQTQVRKFEQTEEMSLLGAVAEAALAKLRDSGVPPDGVDQLISEGYLLPTSDSRNVRLRGTSIAVSLEHLRGVRMAFPARAEELNYKKGTLVSMQTGQEKLMLSLDSHILSQNDIRRVNVGLWKRWQQLR